MPLPTDPRFNAAETPRFFESQNRLGGSEVMLVRGGVELRDTYALALLPIFIRAEFNGREIFEEDDSAAAHAFDFAAKLWNVVDAILDERNRRSARAGAEGSADK